MSRKKVLVVDDITENIIMLTSILKPYYDVYAAKSGKAALNSVNKNLPNIILLDVMMPEMDGYQVCTILKSDPKTSKINLIFVTAMDQYVDELKGFDLGAVDYLIKPVHPSVVRARVATHIALHEQNNELERQVIERTKEMDEARQQVIQRLSRAAEYKDTGIAAHIDRMSKYCYAIAMEYGFSENDANLLLNAAPMHDIGKIGIPDEILKKGKLTEDEQAIMHTHCDIGAHILGNPSTQLLQIARTISLQHHERYDGTGYPEGLTGNDIDINARISSVANKFDLLTNDNMSPQKAATIIDSLSGQYFDPNVVCAFNNAMPNILNIMAENP